MSGLTVSSDRKSTPQIFRMPARKETGRPANEHAMQLLQEDPEQFVLAWQETIGIIVRKYHASGLFTSDEIKDVSQFINHRLLEDVVHRMQKQFDGSTRMVTYFSRIVQNLCLEYRRKNKAVRTVEISEEHATAPPDFAKLLIADEVARLKRILQLFAHIRPRLVLLLKLYARRPLTASILEQFCPQGDKLQRKTMLGKFGESYPDVTDKEIYASILPFMIDCEKKKRSADALRKWTDEKVGEIIELLNGRPPQRTFDRETFRILFQKFDQQENMGND